MKINYDMPDELVRAWRAHVLRVKGSQRGGREMMEQAMREFLDRHAHGEH
jgi:hypothetical protein